jgi:dTDP-4-dehydrorhamnose reductase
VVPVLRLEHDVIAASSSGDDGFVRVDITDPLSVQKAMSQQWDLVIHGAGLVDVGACECNPDLAWRVNVQGAENVVRNSTARVLYFSTDYVFDSERACDEETTPDPPNVYGETKLAAEERVLEASPQNLVVRLPFLYGFGPAATKFVERFDVDLLEVPEPMIFAPLYAPDVAIYLERLLQFDGLVHFRGGTTLSRLEFFRMAAEVLQSSCTLTTVDPMSVWPRRPASSEFVSSRMNFTGRDVQDGLAALGRARGNVFG